MSIFLENFVFLFIGFILGIGMTLWFRRKQLIPPYLLPEILLNVEIQYRILGNNKMTKMSLSTLKELEVHLVNGDMKIPSCDLPFLPMADMQLNIRAVDRNQEQKSP